MGRYESNIMTYVRPTNYKLIDRSTRYVMMLRP
jgi:N-acetylmuramic acid 6-phosphate (MurNAc-6-P) etherase